MASARVVGTNENIDTFGASGQGRDYTSMNTWESDHDVNMVTAQESHVLECYDDSASFAVDLTVRGGTTNSTYFRIIRPAAGQGHSGDPDVGFQITNGVSSIFTLDEAYFSLQDIIITNTSTGAGNKFDILSETSNHRVIAVFCHSSDAASFNQCFAPDAGNSFWILCGATEHGWRGFFNRGGTNRYYNCIGITAGTGDISFARDGSTMICKNCLSDDTNGGTCFSGSFSSSNNNASTDGTAPGTSSRTNQTFTFVDAANNDWHLDAADAGANNFGADLSGDANFAFDQDIDEDVFNTWDIGFDENDPVAVGGSLLIPRRPMMGLIGR